MYAHLYGMTGEQMEKIFPASYYTNKDCKTQKILEFEKRIIQQAANKSQLNFKHRESAHKRVRSAIPKQQARKTKMSHYDTFQDTINKNKQELKRISSYNAILEMKLKLSPRTKNTIRSPAKNERELEDSLYFKMKAIEDMEFQRKQKTKRELRIESEKRSVCKFINKCKTAREPIRRKISQVKINPEEKIKTQRTLALKLQEIALESLQKNSSINLTATKATERDAGYISTLNTAIKKSNSILKKAGVSQREQEKILKIFRKRASKTCFGFHEQKQKKNLISQTQRIREQTKSMATLKRYDVILQKKAAQKDLQSQ